MLAQLHIGRVVKIKRLSGAVVEVFAHVIGFSLNSVGETIVVVQTPKYLKPYDETVARNMRGMLSVTDFTETFAIHPGNISIDIS